MELYRAFGVFVHVRFARAVVAAAAERQAGDSPAASAMQGVRSNRESITKGRVEARHVLRALLVAVGPQVDDLIGTLSQLLGLENGRLGVGDGSAVIVEPQRRAEPVALGIRALANALSHGAAHSEAVAVALEAALVLVRAAMR